MEAISSGQPLVTIGLPIYNAEAYLADCIESIKAQTLREFEVLAVLDGGTDRSAEILRKHADSRFRILDNGRNIGLAATCNRMLELCQTELLARMDSDDLMRPERLRRQYDFMQTHPDVDVLGTYFDTIDETGRVIAGPVAFSTTPEAIREEYRVQAALHHPTLMYRVKRIIELGGYPDSHVSEDTILWLRGLSQGFRYANLPEVHCSYRIHSSQMMNRLREATLAALDKAYADFGPQIWGDRAPDYVSGLNRWERLRRRLKRNLTRLISS
ncbi:MAG: glycosyltransferase [bacterium]|nr:glycosyltransferase [bacterium]MBK8130825.1 glycosyltransferase [bacterium]